MKIYLASSWRNPFQPKVITALREAGHEVYDFRHPLPGNNGFHWSEIDEQWQKWTPAEFKLALSHPVAQQGFSVDLKAMLWAYACVLVLPCGRSAHLEAGYFIGRGKPTAILLADGEPELMYKLGTHICLTIQEVIEKFEED